MTQQTSINKTAALDDLYARFTRVAREMGGAASRLAWPVTLDVEVPSRRTEDAPALRVEMPDGFQVELVPRFPLSSPGNTLSVQAIRTLTGARKTDRNFNFGPNGWQVLDDEIRSCLTPEGPPAVW